MHSFLYNINSKFEIINNLLNNKNNVNLDENNFKIPLLRFIPSKHHYHLKSLYLINALQYGQDAGNPSYSTDLSYLNSNSLIKGLEYILFIPCVQWGNRSISLEDSKKILAEVVKSRFNIYLSGGHESLHANLELLKSFDQFKDRIIFQEKLSLIEFVDIIKNSTAVICGDSGPMHIAALSGIPMVAMMGPQSPHLFRPWGKQAIKVIYKDFYCSPCWQFSCLHVKDGAGACVTAIKPEDVFDAAKAIFQKGG